MRHQLILCTAVLTGLSLGALNGPAQALEIVDAPNSGLLQHQIQMAVEQFKVLDLYPDHSFQGERPFTRYELADALSRSLEFVHQKYALPLKSDPQIMMLLQGYLKPSGDIPIHHWALAGIQRSLAYGLLSGDAQLRFHGGHKVTRYQLAQAIYQVFDWLQVQPILAQQKVDSSDVPAQHWAADAVQEVLNAHIMDVDKHGHFDGERPATRYELSTALVRLLQQVDLLAARDGGFKPKDVVPLPELRHQARPDGRMPPFRYTG